MTISYNELVFLLENPAPNHIAEYDPDELACAFFEAFPKLIAEKEIEDEFFHRHVRERRDAACSGADVWKKYYDGHLDEIAVFDNQCTECEARVKKVFAFVAATVPTGAGSAFFREWLRTEPYDGAVYHYSLERSCPNGCKSKAYFKARNDTLTAFARAGLFDDVPRREFPTDEPPKPAPKPEPPVQVEDVEPARQSLFLPCSWEFDEATTGISGAREDVFYIISEADLFAVSEQELFCDFFVEGDGVLEDDYGIQKTLLPRYERSA